MKRFVLFVLAASLVLSGCYFKRQVETNEVGLVMSDGVKIDRVVGAGRYSDLGFYSELEVVDVSAKTLEWNDPDLVTGDKQPIGVQLSVTYARDRSKIEHMWEVYNAETRDDTILQRQVEARIPRVAKEVTAKFTLDEMLGITETESSGRTFVTSELFNLLEPELKEIDVVLLDVGINNISPSESYLNLLQQKADAQVAVEVAREEAKKLQEQLNQEEAQTDIELEQARRENLVNEELAKTYELNDRYYELERLRLLQGVIGDNDKLIFIPQGEDITYFLTTESGNSNPVPIPSAGGPEEGNR